MRRRVLGQLAMVALVAGCSGTVQERVGLGNRVPDEFQVVRRAPLVVPPDYNLTPPHAEGEAPLTSASSSARQVVLGSADGAIASGRSASERLLLSHAAVQADPLIRRQLLEDVGQVKQLDESQFLTILDWQKPTFDGDEALDPVAEAERLDSEGKPVTVTTVRTGGEVVPAEDGAAATGGGS